LEEIKNVLLLQPQTLIEKRDKKIIKKNFSKKLAGLKKVLILHSLSEETTGGENRKKFFENNEKPSSKYPRIPERIKSE